jgi:Fe2+ or Zn2+ uptake regulation protein
MGNIDEAKTEARVAGFLAACREHGIKATHQRIEIVRELASTEDHPDAESIYERVQERIPTISLDTVYRTLRLLEDNDIISRVGSMDGVCGSTRKAYCFIVSGRQATPLTVDRQWRTLAGDHAVCDLRCSAGQLAGISDRVCWFVIAGMRDRTSCR